MYAYALARVQLFYTDDSSQNIDRQAANRQRIELQQQGRVLLFRDEDEEHRGI